MILKGYLFGIGYALVCLLLSLSLYKLGLPKKYTRKVVHILVGFEWVILYHYMGAGVHFLAVCILFLLLLTVAYKGRLMPMISSDDDNAPGTVYYAAAMTGVSALGCFIPSVMLPFGIGVMCTSVGDGLAGVVGQAIEKCNPKIFANKSLFGTLTNVVVSTCSAYVISSVYSLEIGIGACLLIGLLSAELEVITPYGLDNVTVTWGATALAFSFMYFADIWAYLVPIVFTPLIIIFAISKRALTTDGVIAAIVLDIAVSIAFGNSGFILLCVFFVGSIIIDKVKKHYKKEGRKEKTAKGDCRDYMQVLANGLPAFVFSIAFIITENPIFSIPFAASLAEAFADTAASGIGAFSRNTYDPFRMKKCERGLSGGMSVIGTLASLLAAISVSLIAYATGFFSGGTFAFVIVSVSAFLGAVFDSLLGSLLQVKFKCVACGTITEKSVHCGKVTAKHSGVKIIDNDTVNLISSSFAAILATLLALML
jgi:uncharacterized protein (TIGR00297 family)